MCQDIKQLVKHSQDADRTEPTHIVEIKKDSTLYNIYNKEKVFVNSFHHQAVSEPGNHLRTIAKSSDHIIEAVESSEYKQILGVQWHPEWLEEEGLKIFQWLVNQANNFMQPSSCISASLRSIPIVILRCSSLRASSLIIAIPASWLISIR